MARRSLQEWAHVAEIVAAFAVVVSLAYVAYELRENTRALESTSRQSIAAQDLAFISTALDPSVIARAHVKSQVGEELSSLEVSQLRERQHLNFRVIEHAYYQFTIGALEESEWARYDSIISMVICDDPFAQDMWQAYKPSFTVDFQQVVESIGMSCAQ